jgi:hypothetical protein
MQKVQVWRLDGHRDSSEHESRAKQRQIEALAVEGDQHRGLSDPVAQALEHGRLLV